MKNFILALSTTLLLAAPLHSEEGLRLRYNNLSGPLALTLSHDIEVVRVKPDEPVTAHRTFSFDMTLASEPGRPTALATVDGSKGTYLAHGQKARLGTRHLAGQHFPLAIEDGGRRLTPDAGALVVELGPPVEPGISVADTLAAAMPILPESAVAVGDTWTSERSVRSLEGWKWSSGKLVSQHKVEAVDHEDGHAVVTVVTRAQATLDPLEGKKESAGDLKQSLTWRFDATEGRLLTLSMEQKSDLLTIVPQGEIHVRQTTLVEIAPGS
jgi:hypothetical protein